MRVGTPGLVRGGGGGGAKEDIHSGHKKFSWVQFMGTTRGWSSRSLTLRHLVGVPTTDTCSSRFHNILKNLLTNVRLKPAVG